MACTATAISHNRGRHGERRRGQRRGHRHCWQCCCKLLCSKSLLVVRLGGQRVALRSYEICNRRGALRECRNLNTRLRFELLRQRLTHTHKLADDGRICTRAGAPASSILRSREAALRAVDTALAMVAVYSGCATSASPCGAATATTTSRADSRGDLSAILYGP